MIKLDEKQKKILLFGLFLLFTIFLFIFFDKVVSFIFFAVSNFLLFLKKRNYEKDIKVTDINIDTARERNDVLIKDNEQINNKINEIKNNDNNKENSDKEIEEWVKSKKRRRKEEEKK